MVYLSSANRERFHKQRKTPFGRIVTFVCDGMPRDRRSSDRHRPRSVGNDARSFPPPKFSSGTRYHPPGGSS